MKSPIEIKVTDFESAAEYIHALVFSEWDYHIDDDVLDMPTIPLEVRKVLWDNTLRARGTLGVETAWEHYRDAVKERDFQQNPETYLEMAVEEAVASFWSAVAREFPGIKKGDISPLDTMTFEKACRTAVEAWIKRNSS